MPGSILVVRTIKSRFDDVREALAKVVKNAGADIRVVEGVDGGATAFRERPANVVIADMPSRDRTSLTERIQGIAPDVKVFGVRRERERADEDGIENFKRPDEFDKLASRVAAVLGVSVGSAGAGGSGASAGAGGGAGASGTSRGPASQGPTSHGTGMGTGAGAGAGTDVRGNLVERNPCDVLLELTEARATGVLTLVRGGSVKEMFIGAGVPYLARSSERSESLAEVLGLSTAARDAVFQYLQEHNVTFTEALVAKGFIGAAEAEALKARATHERLIDGLGWVQGTYSFVSGAPASAADAKTVKGLPGPIMLVLSALDRSSTLDRVREFGRAYSDLPVHLTDRFERYKGAFEMAFAEASGGATFATRISAGFLLGDLTQAGSDPARDMRQAYILHAAGLVRFGAADAARGVVAGAAAAAAAAARAEVRARRGSSVEEVRAALAALEKDPSDRAARGALMTYLREGEVEPLYFELADRGAALVGEARDGAGYLADLHCEVAEAFHRELHRMGEAAARYRRALKADPQCRRARAACRAIYEVAGEHAAVAKLYEEELGLAKDDDARADVHFALGRLAMNMLGDPASAAAHLRKALELRSLDAAALEALSEAYLAMGHGPEGRYARLAADALTRLARVRLSNDPPDWAGALNDCKRALEAEPESNDANELLESIYRDSGAWAELEELYRKRLPRAEAAKRLALLRKLGALEGVGRAGVARDAFEQMIGDRGNDPAFDQARTSLRSIYERAGAWQKLARLREGDIARAPDARSRNLVRLDLAEICFTRLGRPGLAASWIVEAVKEEPEATGPLDWARLRFARRGDWATYLDILERSLDAAHWRPEVALERKVARLEEMALTAEKRLHDPQKALAIWRRIHELVPADPIAKRSLGKLSAPPAPDDPVRRLEREAQNAATGSGKVAALHAVGKAWEKRDTRRAIAAHEEVLTIEEADEGSLEALDRLYTTVNEFGQLATTLRARTMATDDMAAKARLLARLAELRYDRLADFETALAACRELLRIDPRNETAVSLRRRIYEETDNAEGIMGVLAHRAQYATDPETRAEVYAEMAVLAAEKLSQDDRAASLWEQVLEVHPSDPRALKTLAGIYERLERWEDLAKVLYRLAREAAPGSSERADLWRRLAYLVSQELDAPERELEAWRELAQVRPLDAQAWEGQAEILAKLERWEEWAPVAARLVPLIRDRERAKEVARNAAGILEHKLKRPAEAAAIMQSYIDRHTGRDGEISSELGRLHERRQDWRAALAGFEIEIFASGPKADRASMAQHIADVWRDKITVPGPAILAYQRVQAFNKSATAGWEPLAQLAQKKGDFRNLAVVREFQLAQEQDPARRASVLLETADLYESRGGDVDRAVGLLRQAAREFPEAREPIAALEKLAARHGRWDALLAVYEDRAKGAVPAERVKILHEVADVCATRLGDVDGAIAAYRRAYVLHPEVESALPALVAAVEKHDRYPTLVEAYLSRARAAQPKEAVELTRRAAHVYLDKTHDVDAAMAILRRAAERYPEVPESLAALREAVRRNGRWTDLIGFYEGRVAESEGSNRVKVLHEIARIQDSELTKVDESLATLRRAYDLDPGEPEALAVLDSTLIQKQRWEDLLELLDERAKVALPADRVELLHRAAQICIDELNDADRQIGMLKRALQLAPGEARALDAYRNALLSDERWPELVELHRALANRAGEDGALKRKHLAECVRILRHELKDFTTAFRITRNLFDVEKPDVEALTEIEQIAAEGGEWEGLGQLYQAIADRAEEGSELRFQTLTKLAVLLEERLASPEPAYARWLKAFAGRPGDPGTIENLRRLAEKTSRWEPLLGVHQTLVQMTGDPEEKVALLRRNAVIQESKLADQDGAFETLLEAFGYDPEDEEVRQEVWRLSATDAEREKAQRGTAAPEVREDGTVRPPRRWGRLIQVYEARIQDSEEVSDRVRYLRRIGRVFAMPLGDIESAFKVLALAAKLSPRDPAPLDDIEDYGRRAFKAPAEGVEGADTWDRVLETFRHQIEDADDHAVSVVLYNRMARIAEEEIQDMTRAEEYSRRTLAMQPDDSEALGRLKRILRRGARSSDLATTLEREAGEAKGEDRRRVLLELASLWEGELTNPREAALIYEKILAETPDDREVLGKLIKLYEETHDTRKLAEAYKRAAAKETDKVAADELRKKVARLYMDVLQEPKQALEIFRSVFEGAAADGRTDHEALDALDGLYERLHRWDELLVISKVRAQVVHGDEREKVLVRQARILEEFKKEPEKAAEILRSVLATSPGNADARVAMIRNLRGASDWDGLITFCGSILGQGVAGDGTPGPEAALAAQLHAEMGDANFRLGHHELAAGSFERALVIDTAYRPALSGLRAIREWREEWAEAVAIAEREAQLSEGADKVELYRHAAEIRRDKLADPDGARTLLRAALDQQPDSAEVARALTGFAAGADDWRRILRALQARLESADNKAEKVALYIEIGRTHARGFGNRADALAAFERALDLKPGSPGALVAMAELFDAAGELEAEGVARKLEGELSEAMLASELAKDSVETGRLFLYYAKVLLAQNKVDQAIQALRRARDKYPRLLHVALGLGEALYRAVRFPEAEPHYRFAAEHVTIHDYPEESAEALYRLGLIARSRNELEKALNFLERAAGTESRAGEALLSAAEVAREMKQPEREIEYLERLVPLLVSPGDRAVVRARLGQAYADDLQSPDKAIAVYRLAMADQLAAVDAGEGTLTWDVAGRLLELCLQQDALAEANDVAQRIAATDDWGEEAATVALRLGAAFERLRDPEQARKHIWRAIELDPSSEEAFQAQVRYLNRREDWRALAELLDARLGRLGAKGWEAGGAAARAALLVELARVYVRGLDQPQKAVPLLDEAAALCPDDREITRVQIELLSEGWKKPDELVELHRGMIEREPWNVESVRALIPLLRRLDATKRSYWPAAILDYFGLATAEEKQVAEYHRPSDVRRGGQVMDPEMFLVLSPADARLLEEVFRLVWEGGGDLFMETLESAALKNEDRVSPLAEIPAAKAFKYVSRLMGTRVLGLFAKPLDGGSASIDVLLTKPPALVARGVENHNERALMFRFGRALQACRSEYVAFIAPEDEVEARVLYDAVMGAFHPGVKPKDIPEAAREMAKQLRRKLGIRTREKIAEMMKTYVERYGAPDFGRWNRAVWAAVNRAGILMCGDLELGLDIMLGVSVGSRPQGPEGLRRTCEENAGVADLLRFVLSGDFFWLRAKLGFQSGWTGKTSLEAINAEARDAARRAAASSAASVAAGAAADLAAGKAPAEAPSGETAAPDAAAPEPPATEPSAPPPSAVEPSAAVPVEASAEVATTAPEAATSSPETEPSSPFEVPSNGGSEAPGGGEEAQSPFAVQSSGGDGFGADESGGEPLAATPSGSVDVELPFVGEDGNQVKSTDEDKPA